MMNNNTIMVILVFGVLFFSSVFIKPGQTSASSRITRAMIRIEYIEMALYKFGTDVKRLPTTDEGLLALVKSDGFHNWKGPYFPTKGPPKDPWGNEYKYIYPAELGSERFDLYSFGKNKKDDLGEKDDIFLGRKTNSGYYDSSYSLGYFEVIYMILIFDLPVVLLSFFTWNFYKRKNKITSQ